MSYNRCESSLKFLYFGSEGVEIFVEFFLRNIHDIVFDLCEGLDCVFKFLRNLHYAFGKGFTLGSSEFYTVKFVELFNGVAEMEDVVASFEERIKADEESVCG